MQCQLAPEAALNGKMQVNLTPIQMVKMSKKSYDYYDEWSRPSPSRSIQEEEYHQPEGGKRSVSKKVWTIVVVVLMLET
jgi:hypothetical protein